MIYVFNKSKILSYMVASFTVIVLFAFSTSVIPNKDIELVKVSTNVNCNNTYENTNKINIAK